MSKNASGREVISFHLGQAGIQMGASLWEQYCKEHKIGLDGVRKEKRYRMAERVRMNDKGEWERVPVSTPMSPKVDKNTKQKMNDDFKSSTNSDNNNNNTSSSEKKDQYNRKRTLSEEEFQKFDLSGLSESLQRKIRESQVFFSYNGTNDTHCPRAVLVDLEPNVIDDVMNSAFGSLFNESFLVKGNEDAANNYARGHYTVGAEYLDRAIEATRKNIENCDHCQAFIFNMAVGGGTGSGFGGLLEEYLTTEHKKKPKIAFTIYPSMTQSTCVVEPYNALLATHDCIDHNNITVVLDNEAGYEICMNKLNFAKPSYFNINRLIGKVTSSITSGLRFPGQQQFTVSDIQTNLVPYPRLHFMTCGMGPILADTSNHDFIDEAMITNEAFRTDSMFTKYHDWDPETDRYMGVSVTYRGNCTPKECNAAVQKLKGDKVQLVDWCPTGFKLSMIERMPSYLGDDGLKPTDKQCVMIGNNTAVVRPFENRIAKKYDLMYSQRAFVHWYVGEGMEEGEFAEAREDMQMLIQDYDDANKDQVTDRVDSDDDDGGSGDD